MERQIHTTLSLSLFVMLSLAHPSTCTCLHIPSQHLAWHLALLRLSEQFKWIIRLVMRRKWIVHLLISDQSPLSCSWCRIRLALCEMTPDSVQHCNTLWVPVKSRTSSPGREPFLCRQLTSSIPHQMRHKRHVSIISAPCADVNLYQQINKERRFTQAQSLILILLPNCFFLSLSSTPMLSSRH